MLKDVELLLPQDFYYPLIDLATRSFHGLSSIQDLARSLHHLARSLHHLARSLHHLARSLYHLARSLHHLARSLTI